MPAQCLPPCGIVPHMQADELDRKLESYKECRILLTAIELNVFTAVDGGATVAHVARRIRTEPRATEMLLNALVALKMLRKTDGVFENEPLAATLLTDSSPENVRLAMLHTVHRWETWSTLTDRVRGRITPVEYRMRGSARHEQLLARLHRKAAEQAPELVLAIGVDGVRRVLDIGGGSGAYAIALANASPEIEVDVVDLPDVVPIMNRYVAAAGLGGRVRTRSGDLLKDEFGTGYDLALLSSVTHLLSEQENRDLIARCRRALASSGRLVIRDWVLDSDKTSPREATITALQMLVATPHGSTYSCDEYAVWLRDAGFAEFELRQLEGGRRVVVGR